MATIHVLDETTINKIAAGEVVERPASVIKELIENSIDASATNIEVEIGDGGVAYMRITDNGIGMTEEDARLAILRHATSKIQQVEDLFDIASLGFRGEALASIASVSHFSLTTRKADSDLGTRITVDGGTFTDCIPYGSAPGTTIEIRDLFYNTPARRKFLKSERTEASKIQDILGKLALSNPHISFKLIVDDRVAIITPGNGNIGDTVAALYGYKTKDDIFTVAYESDSIYIDGVVSKPTLLKSTRIWQTIIVNNRVISDKTIMKAIDNAYHALLPKNGHPLVVLNITVPAGMVDINVHPRKSEVKFSDDKIIFKAVYHGILNALNNPLHERYERESSVYMGISESLSKDSSNTHHTAINQGDDNTNISHGNSTYDSYRTPPVVHDDMQSAEHIATAVDYDKVFGGRRTKGYEVMRGETTQFVENLKAKGYTPPAPKATYEQSSFIDESFDAVPKEFTSYTKEDIDRFKSLSQDIREQDSEERTIQNSGFLPMGQVASCYILAKKGDDLYIIDQHAAHERVRYDKLCKSSESIPMQSILVPQYSEATDDEMNLVEEERATLLDLGFDVELGGPTKIKLVGAPVDLVESKAFEILQYVFSYLHEHQQPTKAQLRHEMLAYASCRGAIKAGHNLNMYQMTTLIEDLFSTEKPYVCPHGRPTIIKFTPDELGKLFLRS
ncbi:DNA mismatch repair endonuclease MutL [Veillonella sp.]|uniref:DNA mismatch repair endonuclease MutL n=1 Tax=Veillonella sp. TaxID=1926307 RepID=UPI00291176D7|nr:DNA mismatch repair endonuclease MutL [Veillonella sp.]MDU3432881.1 DNA mismatch repair endonuclease MutL [Veillonella sp.]MDU3563821.1 DNA mismatch repair endonuclease MutL [Veillonella sp.]MDU3630276.1 DNA mismatch repair endonuclease MutL [Veillonella sp.]MDU5494426.1 DNA mismatch repair endonuclease MutL [Veillonella sp.]